MNGRRALGAALGAGLLLVAACSAPTGTGPRPGPGDRAVVVASFNFTESAVLAEIYAQALEQAGIPVRHELDLGPRELVRPAVRRGLVDVLPEYLGTALATVRPGTPLSHRSTASLLAELRRAVAQWRLDVLTPSAAQDRNGFAVTAATAAKWHLRTLGDLAPVAPRLVLGGPVECPQRPLCLPGLERVYGLRFRGFAAFDDQGQRATALTQGVVDVAVTFTTDPRLADGSLVLLADDKGLQPDESVVPIVSRAAVDRYGPLLAQTLDAVSAKLDSRALTFLDWRVGVAGKDLRTEARAWLGRHGLAG